MIVPMQKITLVCLADDREDTLRALRDAGVLHLQPVTEPECEDIDALDGRLAAIRSALGILDAAGGKAAPAPRDDAPAPDGLVARVHELTRRRQALDETIRALDAEVAALEPFGDFDPDQIRALAERGVQVKLYRVPGKHLPPAPEGATLHVLRRDASGSAVAVAARGEVEFDGVAFGLPAESLGRIRSALRDARAEATAIEQSLAGLAAHRDLLERHVEQLDDERRYLAARAGMGRRGRLAYLRGFCPVDRADALREKARRHGWALVLEEPAPDDPVPTLIRNPAWIRPIQVVFSAIQILPGYREADVSGSFLVFLSIFFAMIVGDAGYGLLFLAITAVARRLLRKAPAALFHLLTVFSVCTIAWGVATGAYFGVTALPAPLARLRVHWLTDNRNIMSLCLMLGAIHLSVAHLWNGLRMLNSLRALAQAGWLTIVWSMFFAGRTLLLDAPFPAWYIPVAVVGVTAVVLFMTPPARLKSDWIHHAMLPLNLMSNFGDILSYLRLFALGVASVRLAGAFNTIITDMLGFHGPLTGLLSALLLFVGHAVNIALSLMSVLVHGVRLNALEFSMHMGLEWAGVPYAPFARRTVRADEDG